MGRHEKFYNAKLEECETVRQKVFLDMTRGGGG